MTDLTYRRATREEFEIAVAWAAAAGWNPGLDDSEVFWETDPEGYVVVERQGEVIGTGSIVSYGTFGFMGFFIVREDLRGQGIGRGFWHWRKETLEKRLDPGAAIGMDGVFEMQPFYAGGGFVFSHRNLRMEGIGREVADGDQVNLTKLTELPFEMVAGLDRRCFGFDRGTFLRRWVALEHGCGLGAVVDGRLLGFGVIRQCGTGHKIGPLFAETPEVAESLFAALQSRAVGQPIFLDIPENNPAAVALAKREGMNEVFGCARMYAGPAPALPWNEIYGVTTFELG